MLLLNFFESLRDGVVTQLLSNLTTAMPKFLGAVLLFLAGWLIAKLIRRLLLRLLRAIKIDKLAGGLNDIDMLYKNNVKILPSAIIAQAVYLMVMLVTIIATTDILGIQAITEMVSDLLNYLPALFTGGLILVFGLMIADFVRKAADSMLRSMGISAAGIISNIIFYILFVSIALSALSQAKIQTGFLANNLTVIISAGALAFAIGYGFASRDLLSNYMANIYNKEKIRIGDQIIIDGKQGQIVMIDNTSLVLQTDDRAIIVPLSKLTSTTVEIIYPEAHEGSRLGTGA